MSLRTSREPACLALVVIVLSLPAGPALARACDQGVVAGARRAIDASCPCDVSRHDDYVACAAGVLRHLVPGVLPKQCARLVARCVARSSCGRPGRVVCCRARARHAAKCRITTAARCVAAGGCVGTQSSCCDACGPEGCVGTTSTTLLGSTTTLASTSTTVTTTSTTLDTTTTTTTTVEDTTSTTTTTLASVCGNGTIEFPNEQCDGDPVCAANCFVQRYACCLFGSEPNFCAADVPLYTLFVYQNSVCGNYGGTFHTGYVASGTAPCQSGPNGTEGGCVPAPVLAEPVTVCCQRPTLCEEFTSASITDIDGWYWYCAYTSYPNQRFVVGTCGADGVCVPAH